MPETLGNIKNDLDTTVGHLERLSAAMVGYMLFNTARGTPSETEGMVECLKGIEDSIQRLKIASSKITMPSEHPDQPTIR